ncbi:S1 family peptidase, partial [Streptomyces sp. NPDC059524]
MLQRLRRPARTLCTGAVAAGALFVAGLSGSANATADPASHRAPSAAQTMRTAEASPAVIHAMQRDLGISEKQAYARLANEAEAGATAGRLRLTLGKDFAGAWVRGADSGTLTVATTDAKDVAAIEARGATAAVVGHSLA